MMSSFTAICAFVVAFSGTLALRIEQLDIPDVIRNGTGPLDLSCIYEVGEDEDGLVVKWYHNENELIYQWIPPMAPQDTGLITGRAEYPDEILKSPRSRSIIRLREVALEMGGNYTCVVSTFQSEQVQTKRMIVYAPEKNASVSAPAVNETHINLVCEVEGAWPQPVFEFRFEGAPVDSRKVLPKGEENYEDNGFRIRHEALAKEPETPALLECGIVIPGTDYRRRESVVYYPRTREFLWELAMTAFQKNNNTSSMTTIDSHRMMIALALFSLFLSQIVQI